MNTRIAVLITFLLTSTLVMSQEKTISSVIKPYSYKTHEIKLNDSTTIAYVDEGIGDRTIIFIHGLATYLPSWQKNIDVLKKHYRCIAVDLPGYGRSSKSLFPPTMSFYADVINQLIDRLKLKNVILAGHSMGAQVSITTALKYPEKVDAMILAAPAGFETFNEQEAVWIKSVFTPEAVASATPAQIRFNYELNFYKMPADIEFMIEDRLKMTEANDFMMYCKTVSAGVSSMLNEPVFKQLRNIKQPVMVIYGKNDALIPNQILHKGMTTTEVATKGSAEIPDSQLEMIPECGHFVPFEKPDIFNKVTIDFIEEIK